MNKTIQLFNNIFKLQAHFKMILEPICIKRGTSFSSALCLMLFKIILIFWITAFF